MTEIHQGADASADTFAPSSEDAFEEVASETSDAFADEAFVDEEGEGPISEAHAASTFAGVSPALRAAMERRGFSDLTAVQKAVLGDELNGKDLRISSQTGSGKTVALGIVLYKALADSKRTGRAPSAMVITPTRELAAQVQRELEWLLEKIPDARVDVVTGGTSVMMERKRLARGPRIVVGTPGRILDHMQGGALDVTQIQQLVLDEADQMLDLGFRDELEGILKGMPEGRRTHLVSATFAPEVRRLADRYQTNAQLVEGTRLGKANEDIEHSVHVVRPQQRYAALVNLLLMAQAEGEPGADGGRTLVFVRTRVETAEVAEQLARDGFRAAQISGDLAQAQRTRTLNQFRAGAIQILVATDVAARGIDVPEVTTVVHFEAPTDRDTYTHRSGRTGRAGRKGRSLLLVPPQARRRVERLIQDAKVQAHWKDVPSADKVRKAFTKQSRKALFGALTAEPGPAAVHVEYATKLLEEHSAAHVIAVLLSQRNENSACEPHDLEPVKGKLLEPRQNPMQKRDRRDAPGRDSFGPPRGARQDFGDDFGGDTRGPRRNARRDDAAEGGFVRFFVNYGFRHGAAPNRVLALACRRGDIAGTDVGSIDIGDNGTTFDVHSEVAAQFEENARRPDPRDPTVHIERFDPRGGRPQRNERPQSFAPQGFGQQGFAPRAAKGGPGGGPARGFGGPRPQFAAEEGAPRPYAPKLNKKKFPGKTTPRVNP